MTAEGFIALQVHSIGEERKVGTQVQWRDIKILTEGLEDARWEADPEVAVITTSPK